MFIMKRVEQYPKLLTENITIKFSVESIIYPGSLLTSYISTSFKLVPELY